MAAPTTPATPPRAQREEVFAWMAKNAASTKQAADHFGVNHETIRSWTKRHGHPCKDAVSQAGAPQVPNAAAALPPDDRAELLKHVRSLRRRLVMFDKAVQDEMLKLSGAVIDDDGKPAKFDKTLVDALTRAASATASEMAKVLEAHPGLMALADEGKPVDDAADANRLAGLYGGSSGLG